MTVVAFFASKHNIDVSGMTMRVNKEMRTKPYGISKIELVFDMPDREYSEKEKTQIERAANSCPVHGAFRPEIEQVFTFNWKK